MSGHRDNSDNGGEPFHGFIDRAPNAPPGAEIHCSMSKTARKSRSPSKTRQWGPFWRWDLL